MAFSQIALKALQDVVGAEHVTSDEVMCQSYSRVNWLPSGFLQRERLGVNMRPACVVMPSSTEEVQAIIRIANRYKFPFTPRGSGYTFQAFPAGAGYLVIDPKRMDRIIELDGKNMYAVVEPYVVTAQLQAVRMEILQLFMSEHTASCLVCDEKDECRRYSVTIRKAGVTTGCRYCPKDGQCELQEVAERLGVTEIIYPIHYRNLRVENEDPFYDRDYNLCILCGRCIRMCQEVRGVGAIGLIKRGIEEICLGKVARVLVSDTRNNFKIFYRHYGKELFEEYVLSCSIPVYLFGIIYKRNIHV